MVVVALGEPGVPLICCAEVVDATNTSNAQLASNLRPAVPMKIRRLDFMATSRTAMSGSLDFGPASSQWELPFRAISRDLYDNSRNINVRFEADLCDAKPNVR